MSQSDESKEQEELELLDEEVSAQNLGMKLTDDSYLDSPKESGEISVAVPTTKKAKREKGEPRAGITKKIYRFSAVKKARKLAKKQRARNRRG